MHRGRRRRLGTRDAGMTTQDWMQTLPDDTSLLVSEGGTHLGTMSGVSFACDEPFVLEEALLAEYGAGFYSIMPVFGGSMRPATQIAVGNPAEHDHRRHRRDASTSRTVAPDPLDEATKIINALTEFVTPLLEAWNGTTTGGTEGDT